MAKTNKTYLFCLDDHKSFSEEVKKRFNDSDRYNVYIFHNKDELLSSLRRESEFNRCKVVILGIHDPKERYEMTSDLVTSVKSYDPRTGIIILTPPEKSDEIMKSIKFNVDAFIIRNNNSILRIHNTVKKLISEYNLLYYRRLRNISLYSLIAFLAIAGVVGMITFLRLH